MKVKSYENFLNELFFTEHWSKERASKNDPMSRIVPWSPNALDGWKCREVREISKTGKSKAGTSIREFLDMMGTDEKDFNSKVTETLSLIMHSYPLAKLEYGKDTHRMVYLGKIAFEFHDKYYSPVFELEDKQGRVYAKGTEIWAVASDDKAVTPYYLENPTTEQMHNIADNFRLKGNPARTEKFASFSKGDYVKRFFAVDHPFGKSFFVVIPRGQEWEEAVRNQVQTSKSLASEPEIEPEAKEITRDGNWLQWQKHLLEKVSAIMDTGTKILVGDKIKTVKFVETPEKSSNKQLMMSKGADALAGFVDGGMMMIKKGSTINIVTTNDEIVLRDGKFKLSSELKPDQFILVKSFKVKSLGSTKGKNTLYGDIQDYFVGKLEKPGSTNVVETEKTGFKP